MLLIANDGLDLNLQNLLLSKGKCYDISGTTAASQLPFFKETNEFYYKENGMVPLGHKVVSNALNGGWNEDRRCHRTQPCAV